MAQLVSQTQANQSPPIRVEVLRDVGALLRLRPQWLRLFDVAANATAALHPDWVETWWSLYGSVYGKDVEPLRMLCFWRGERLLGLLPLYQRRPMRMREGGEHLCFLSTGEDEFEEICPDYMDLLSPADEADVCAELAWKVLCGELGRSYDRLVLNNMSQESALVRWARRNVSPRDLEIAPVGACPIADLRGGLEPYLGRLSANTRQQARRLLRAAAKAGVSFEVAGTPEEAKLFYEQMIALHQHRWQAAGQPGCFASPRFTEFHGRLVSRWHREGRVVLSRLRLGAEVLAVKYGFRIGRKYDFYQSGVRLDEGSPIKSPGIVSFLHLMGHLSVQEVDTFDFLRGASSYKQRLATAAQPLVEVRRVLWTWRTACGFAVDLGGRAARKVGRTIARRGVKAPPETQEE